MQEDREVEIVSFDPSPENLLRNIADLRNETLAMRSAAREMLDRSINLERSIEIEEAVLNHRLENPGPSAAYAQALSVPMPPLLLDTNTVDAQYCFENLAITYPLDAGRLQQFLIEVKGKSANFKPVVEKYTKEFLSFRKQLIWLKQALQHRQSLYGKKKGLPKRMFDDTLLKRLKHTIIPDLDDLIDNQKN
ncbi:uncharacterized protein LOC129230039 [Uloborus diversus]|uniref:uncharacterized protein LOC129230039 n=1 Tax=Uloborus diversus TaxID=327109 RepID=UPI002409CB74|nr:uncharacterized protein LOC129230039 [Uloborus diversus]